MSGFTKPSSKAANRKPQSRSKPKQNKRKTVNTKEVKVEGKELIPNILGASGAGVSDQINDKLAKPYFETGPKDDALAVDIYGRNNTNVTNKFAEAFEKTSKELLGNAQKSIKDSLKQALKSGDTNPIKQDLDSIKSGLDPKKLKDSLLQSVGGKQGLLNSLSDSLKSSLANNYGLDPSTYDKLKVGLTDAYSAYKKGDLKNAQGVLNLASKLTDGKIDAKVEDLTAQVRTYAGLLETSIKSNLKELTGPLLDTIKDDKVGKVVTASICETAAEQGDFQSLTAMASKYGRGTIQKKNPKITEKAAGNYKFDPEMHASRFKSEWKKVQGQLTTLNPKWDRKQRGSKEVKDLSVYANASKDFGQLVKTDPKEYSRFRIAQRFPSTDVGSLLKKQFPDVPNFGTGRL